MRAAQPHALQRLVVALIGGVTLFCVVTAVIAGVSFERQRGERLAEAARDQATGQKRLQLSVLGKQIQLDIVQVQQFLTDVSATRGQNGLDDGWGEAAKNADAFKRHVAEAITIARGMDAPGLVTALEDVSGAFPAYYQAGQTMARSYVDGGAPAGNTQMPAFDAASETLASKVEAVSMAMDNLQKREAADDAVTEKRLADSQARLVLLFAALALAASGLGAAAIRLVQARLLKPLGGLSVYMGRLAEGDYDCETPYRDRHDELGAMAASIAVFREAAMERRQAREAQEGLRASADLERRRTEQERASAAAERESVVEALARGLDRLSHGDLRAPISQPFPAGFEGLRTDFNNAQIKLAQTLAGISGGADSMRQGSVEIAGAADDLSRRTEQQAASLEQTAAALDQISATINRSTAGAQEASSVVRTARSKAEQSGAVMNQAVSAMGEIEQSSRQIGNIIGVIDEIAFQTNLLALNAGVEAARAGESGRGFAVVAQEVRALAQRSADAAKQIKALIQASESQVSTGVALVGETGRALHEIVEQVARVDQLVGEIAKSSEEQAVGLREINSAVNQMDQVTQQNAAMVEQTTAATHALRNEALELARLVRDFQLPLEPQRGRRAA